MSRFVRFALVATLVLGVVLFGLSSTAFAAGTVKNPSGQTHGPCVNDGTLYFGITELTSLASVSNCKLFGFVQHHNPHHIEVFFNASGYEGDLPVQICFNGRALGSIKVTDGDFEYYLATYLEDNQSCFQTWIGGGSTFFEYIP